jgi:hypothetical protein
MDRSEPDTAAGAGSMSGPQLEQASPDLWRELALERFAPLPAAQGGRIALADWQAGGLPFQS